MEELGAQEATRDTQFERLIDLHLERSYRIARLILRSETEAEDATHDAIVVAWRQWNHLRDHRLFDAWFDRILVNTCRDRLRRSGRRPTVVLRDGMAAAHGGDMLMVEQRHDLAQAFDALNADQRIAVVLRYWSDCSIDDIAARLRCPAGTVKSRLHHAMR